ncbi:hypothetical protein EYF80_051320 [Liparis tanakae]|uniref:Kinesin-like protein KIF26A/B helical domain-containing protein n=1 Tax=Liparis tanakae TaxID=230148 RepID=A0A4Z2FCM1_9TELE|nr:hypothetical protein EYF80_051320 [Liparis tanakae]
MAPALSDRSFTGKRAALIPGVGEDDDVLPGYPECTAAGLYSPPTICRRNTKPEILLTSPDAHHCEPVGSSSTGRDRQPRERPAPEGAGGSRGDPHRSMCQRADAVPSYKSLPGCAGDRVRSTMSAHPGSGRSDRKVACCEKCSATLVALKKQALSLAVHQQSSCKVSPLCTGLRGSGAPGLRGSGAPDPLGHEMNLNDARRQTAAPQQVVDSGDLSAFLLDNLHVHSRSSLESRDRDQGECGACGVPLQQLKQEAVLLALSRAQPAAKPPFERSFSAAALLGPSEPKHADRAPWAAAVAVHPPHGRTLSPHAPRSPRTPQRTPQTLRRRGPKLPNPDMDRWVEQQQQLVASKAAPGAEGVARYHKVP